MTTDERTDRMEYRVERAAPGPDGEPIIRVAARGPMTSSQASAYVRRWNRGRDDGSPWLYYVACRRVGGWRQA